MWNTVYTIKSVSTRPMKLDQIASLKTIHYKKVWQFVNTPLLTDSILICTVQ